jgi:hypothetical protein
MVRGQAAQVAALSRCGIEVASKLWIVMDRMCKRLCTNAETFTTRIRNP